MTGRRLNHLTIFSALIMMASLLTACSSSYEVGFDTRAWRRPSAVKAQLRPKIKAPAVVVVQKGDTVYAISRRHHVEVRTIIDVNDLEPPYALKPGDKLRLVSSTIHVVEKGETSYSISRRYGVDLTSLMQHNRIGPPYGVRIGQQLEIPGAPKKLIARKEPLPPPPKLSDKGFGWPVKGQVISGFGPKQGGLHNDGVNIKAAMRAPVQAAEGGVVAYVGNEIKGYGNLLLLRHDGGWMTAYAHNDRLLVTRGEKVARGQTVALAGMSGNVPAPQLHFEIRKGTVAVNPLIYLR